MSKYDQRQFKKSFDCLRQGLSTKFWASTLNQGHLSTERSWVLIHLWRCFFNRISSSSIVPFLITNILWDILAYGGQNKLGQKGNRTWFDRAAFVTSWPASRAAWSGRRWALAKCWGSCLDSGCWDPPGSSPADGFADGSTRWSQPGPHTCWLKIRFGIMTPWFGPRGHGIEWHRGHGIE